jgi:hypothetical protein
MQKISVVKIRHILQINHPYLYNPKFPSANNFLFLVLQVMPFKHSKIIPQIPPSNAH